MACRHKWNKTVWFRHLTLLRQCKKCGEVQIQRSGFDEKIRPSRWKVVFRKLGNMEPVCPDLGIECGHTWEFERYCRTCGAVDYTLIPGDTYQGEHQDGS